MRGDRRKGEKGSADLKTREVSRDELKKREEKRE